MHTPDAEGLLVFLVTETLATASFVAETLIVRGTVSFSFIV